MAYTWELDGPALAEFAGIPGRARKSLIHVLDALVMVDPMEYARANDATARKPLRTVPFGDFGEGLVTFLIYPPDRLVLVVRVQWSDIASDGA